MHLELRRMKRNEQDPLVQVGRLTARNASYEVGDERKLLRKVRSVVGAATPPGRVSGRQEGQQNDRV